MYVALCYTHQTYITCPAYGYHTLVTEDTSYGDKQIFVFIQASAFTYKVNNR